MRPLIPWKPDGSWTRNCTAWRGSNSESSRPLSRSTVPTRLPAYGLLLVGPAGTGKSQIAYAVARILKLPWTTLDMSSINDPEQLTGSSRIYANAKAGYYYGSFFHGGRVQSGIYHQRAGQSSHAGKGNGNPADVLLTLA